MEVVDGVMSWRNHDISCCKVNDRYEVTISAYGEMSTEYYNSIEEVIKNLEETYSFNDDMIEVFKSIIKE